MSKEKINLFLLFEPKRGELYKNINGQTFVCLESFGADATMVNIDTGWRFQAHGCRKFDDGTIEWDYSTGGYFI